VVDGVLLDLLMAVMNSPEVWAAAVGDSALGLRWRDEVTVRMISSDRYTPYEEIVARSARDLSLAPVAAERLFGAWGRMEPWPDAAALRDLPVPYAFVTNCSTRLATIAARRSGLEPAVVLSAEEAGCYKPNPRIYVEACDRVGTTPVRTLFVAGAPYDADGAAAAGLQSAWVPRRSDVEGPGQDVRVLGSLRDVTAAVRVPGA
jgi:2-haloacid dehalogenase